ncbi:MAG TPA: adenylate/guanylate cyclase domain-containing protein [Elusimicrobiota bacterium]|nr:adenylate/guanylate cyclase domain-containing protein [Elusimicrobiota bacterium]
MRLYLKITLASFAVAAVVLAFVGVNEYRVQRAALERSTGARLTAIAATAARWIDPGSSEYRLRLALLRVKEANGLADYDLYTLKPLPDGTLEFTASLRPWNGERGYTPPASIRPVLYDVLRRGKAEATPLYTDNFATFVSGFAPLAGRNGQISGLIEVDEDVGDFLASARRQLLHQLWILPAALLLAAALSLPLALSLTRAVNVLIAGVEAVRAGRYDDAVKVRTRDELRTLGDAFNGMLRGLRERFAMQRFIPRHTRAVIAEATAEKGADAGAFAARAREVAVLFSDIRGFTAVSEQIAPDRVIEMLNIYLRQEAEIVERHGGSIDKFIGDAVMAVFEGEDRAVRAADAAAEIQRSFRELNARGAFERPIEVGIGIAAGPVVLGAVGYEERMEFAAIGPTVNLASRLCSIAERGEIVASDALYASLAGRSGERRDGVKLKGFAEAVTCWRLAG